MDLQEIAAVPQQKGRQELYAEALERLLKEPSSAKCKEFVEHMLLPDVPLVISRGILHTFVSRLSELPADVQQEVAEFTLQHMAQRGVSFDEQVPIVREFLAALLEEQQDWSAAAKVLSEIDYERASMSLQQKVERFIKITMLYLEEEESVGAEQFFVKASNLINEIQDPVLQLKYKACYARISDTKRKFLEASTRYYELSQVTGMQSPESVNALLQSAVTCAILHPASVHRNRMLATLYKDERITDADAVPQFPFLEKMLMERLITKEEVEAFDQILKVHQKAILADGLTVLQSAVIQHNIRVVSNLYENISLDGLSELLGLPRHKVELLACDMITEGRLKGYIDQVDDVLYFEDGRGELDRWDQQITSTCEELNKIIELIAPAEVA